jgi:hypothetical protein
MTRTQRGVFAGVAAAIAIVAIALVAGGNGGSRVTVRGDSVVDIVGGKPDGGVQVLEYRKGDHVRLTVNSDTADQVHVHGYNLREPLRVGAATKLGFVALIEGEFRIELERTREQIAVLRVRP